MKINFDYEWFFKNFKNFLIVAFMYQALDYINSKTQNQNLMDLVQI